MKHPPESPLSHSPISRIAARCGKGDAASARSANDICMSWRPLRGSRWLGPRQLLAIRVVRRATEN
ncbi:hypothetical protein C6571_07860 [Simplicispira suum]|uniref:Uncharacterized protein n=1 Tax=Simplicispira suum TaxID=2109915 RepID=A0A2S0MZV3_9BURK|nr:hypothetical protein C6571_07860 [Simplicispira suum]